MNRSIFRVGRRQCRSFALMTLLGLCAVACSKEEEKAEKDEDEKVAVVDKQPKKEKPKKAAPKVDKELVALAASIQTQEDFADTAEKEITLDNLEAEADKLEQELSAKAE